MPFTFTPLSLPGLLLVEPRVLQDSRGWFLEMYKKSEFHKGGITDEFVQDNYARSVGKGTVRGLHYQKEPAAQGKLIRATAGEILDVVVDIRRGSPTFGHHIMVTLSEENKRMLWVPPGFAHGYCAMSEVSEVVYKVTHEYSPSHDRGIRWNDPALNIRWPIENPTLSQKDANAPLLADADNNFDWANAHPA